MMYQFFLEAISRFPLQSFGFSETKRISTAIGAIIADK